MGALFNPPKPQPMPPPPPPPAPIVLPEQPQVVEPPKDDTKPLPTPADPAIQQARTQQRQTAARAQGRGATILTSGQGLANEPASGKKKSLLGQ